MMNTDNSFILFLLTFQGQEDSNMQVFDGQTFSYQLRVHSINLLFICEESIMFSKLK